jgi:membrane-associated phospholipid phosphatase
MKPFQKRAFFLKHFLSIFWLTLALIMISYFMWDRRLVHIAFPASVIHFFSAFQGIFATMPHLIFWPVLYFLTRVFFKKKKLAKQLLQIAIAVALSSLFSFALKFLFGRARPELFLNQDIYGFYFFKANFYYHSFPSGHAVLVGAIAGALSCLKPRLSFVWICLAFLLAFTRVIIDMHFLSDVLAGVYLGVVSAQYVYCKFETLSG